MLANFHPKITIGEVLITFTGVAFTLENFLDFLGQSYPLLIGLGVSILFRYIELQKKLKNNAEDTNSIISLREKELIKQLELKEKELEHSLELKEKELEKKLELLDKEDSRKQELHTLKLKK